MARAVIMAGGQGERFWPMTHGKFPKYRIRFDGKDSLLQKTYKRLLKVYPKNAIYIVTTRPHLGLIREELPRLKAQNILVEPFRNNTAAAIFFSCEVIRKKLGDEEVVSFFPADHLIQNDAEFKKTIASAIRLAKKHQCLIAIGIKPSFPAAGYGYIESGNRISGSPGAYRVKRFVEKPDLKKATVYLKKNNFLWNAGIFTWRAGVFMATMNHYSPKFSKHFDLTHLSSSYKKLPNLSIDYALMEKANNVATLRTRMDWCDMGSWDMYFEKLSADKDKNFVHGKTYHKESANLLLLNHTDQPLIALGVRDLIIVKTPHGTLICKKGRAEEAALLFRKMKP